MMTLLEVTPAAFHTLRGHNKKSHRSNCSLIDNGTQRLASQHTAFIVPDAISANMLKSLEHFAFCTHGAEVQHRQINFASLSKFYKIVIIPNRDASFERYLQNIWLSLQLLPCTFKIFYLDLPKLGLNDDISFADFVRGHLASAGVCDYAACITVPKSKIFQINKMFKAEIRLAQRISFGFGGHLHG